MKVENFVKFLQTYRQKIVKNVDWTLLLLHRRILARLCYLLTHELTYLLTYLCQLRWYLRHFA